MKANILITLSRRACIADFGHATTDANDPTNFAIESRTSGFRGGTVRWLAPELMDSSEDVTNVGLASDVYAYACVCYEVVYKIIRNIRIISHCRTDIFRSHSSPRYQECLWYREGGSERLKTISSIRQHMPPSRFG